MNRKLEMEFAVSEGPFVKGVEAVLQSLNVQRQRYTVKTDWCMSLEIVDRAFDFEKSSALFTLKIECPIRDF